MPDNDTNAQAQPQAAPAQSAPKAPSSRVDTSKAPHKPEAAQAARPKAKTPANKEAKRKAKQDKGKDVATGMRSVIRGGGRRSAGKPSVFDEDEKRENASKGLFGGLTPRLMLELAAPHTWAASITPVFLAMCLAAADDGQLSSLMVVVLLLISILLQSAVNAFNDYKDYVAGTDTRENQADPTDAVLVYNDVEPAGARNLALAYVVVALLLGIYVIAVSGLIPLVIAIVGIAFIFLYSAGPRPLSYTPFGELASGIVMGGLITLASYTALTGIFDWVVLLKSVPLIIGIGLIMFTNNTCDIEKDRKAARGTLATLLGRKDALVVYHALIFAWLICIALLVAVFYPTGSLGLFFLLAAIPQLLALFRNPFNAESRGAAMFAITSTNVCLALVYGAAVMLSGIVVIVA